MKERDFTCSMRIIQEMQESRILKILISYKSHVGQFLDLSLLCAITPSTKLLGFGGSRCCRHFIFVFVVVVVVFWKHLGHY